MKSIKCKLVMNTFWGYTCSPIDCDSISEAIRTAKDSGYFAYQIFDETGKKVLKRGFCN